MQIAPAASASIIAASAAAAHPHGNAQNLYTLRVLSLGLVT